jgi:hypothetical protein
MGKLAQISFEYVYLFGFSLVLLTMFAAIASSQITQAKNENEQRALQDTAFILRSEINMALESYDGYTRSFMMPTIVDGFVVNGTIKGKEIQVRTSQKEYYVYISSVQGNFKKGINTINKTRGIIYVN